NLHDFDELGGIGIQVHHVAGFFSCLGSRVHGNAHIGLSQCRSVVGAVASHSHQLAARLLALDQVHFVAWSRLRQEIVNPSLASNGGSRKRIIACDHHGANPNGAKLVEALAHATLDNVFQFDNPKYASSPLRHNP